MRRLRPILVPAERAASLPGLPVLLRRVLLGCGLWFVVGLVAAGTAAARELSSPEPVEELSGVAALVELPGECGADGPLEPGWSIDCRFSLRPGAAEAFFAADLIDGEGTATRCRLDGSRSGTEPSVLRCPDLLRDRFDQGTVSFTLSIDQWVAEGAASVTTTWASDRRFTLYSPDAGEAVVFSGRPLRWSTFFYDEVEGLFITVRERDGGDVLGVLPVPVVDPFVSTDGSIDPRLPVGRYRWWPCVGPSAETCVEQPGGRPFQVIDGEPLEVIPGHNRPTAERINIVFAGSGLDDSDLAVGPLPELARTLLTIGDPLGVDLEGSVVSAGARADRLVWGPMATEPLRSHLDRFNFWYLEHDLGDETSLLRSGLESERGEGFDLPNLQITVLYRSDQRFASDSRGTSFESPQPAEVGPRGQLRFGDARVWIPTNDPLSAAPTLTHEWGHGIFGLRDEYYGFDDRGVSSGFPNCAPDRETAMRWWGDRLGEVDPFVDQVLITEERRLREPPGDRDRLAELVRIDVTAGGCYSDVESSEVFRPSRDSMMNSEIPVFGSVNRARVEEVLARFSGRGPMGSLDDLTLACEGRLGRIDCDGTLRSHLDRPLSIVAIDSIPCEIGRGRPGADGSIGPVPVTCSTVGSPIEPVELTFKAERRSVEVVDVNPPTPPVPMESRIIPTDETAVSAGKGRVVWVGGLLITAAALLIAATAALAFVERRRRAAC